MREKLQVIIDAKTEEDILDAFDNYLRDFQGINSANNHLIYSNIDSLFSKPELHAIKPLENGKRLGFISVQVNDNLSEKSGKKSQYDLAKTLLKENERYFDYGIFLFYDTECNFRYSLIFNTIQENRRAFNTYKRYTYFVDNTQPNTTFLNRITPLQYDSLEQIVEAFSVEKVNKEFYDGIALLFQKLVGGKIKTGGSIKSFDRLLKLPTVDNNNYQKYSEFAVRLIGRAVFVWFLKYKKSIQGTPLIPEILLQSKKVKELDQEGNNYYHWILQYLFFEVLNTPLTDRKSHITENFDSFASIPYLNGGLFEPNSDDGYQKNSDKVYLGIGNGGLHIPNSWFIELFELFEQYNFTIDESSSSDIEISVDPEMLGRIFENLLGVINPETEKSARDQSGSFYTPRHIVEYMVKQTILEYLKDKTSIETSTLDKLLYESLQTQLEYNQKLEIINALDQIKILDPACGSGAYPMGCLQTIIQLLHHIDPQDKIYKVMLLNQIDNPFLRQKIEQYIQDKDMDFIRKKEIIQKSIYGVDIQEIAVEISRLRFFLSLIVDTKVDDTRNTNLDLDNYRNVEPLPNLEFKFVAANSLISLPTTKGQSQFFENEALLEQLAQVRNDYFLSSSSSKITLREKWTNLQDQLKNFYFTKAPSYKDKQNITSRTTLIAQWKPFAHESTPWFDPEWMFGVKSFDIVIGNPPYVSNKGRLEEEKQHLIEQYGFADDLYSHFFFKGLNLLKIGGVLSYITSKTFWTIQSKFNLRNKLFENNLLEIFDTANPFAGVLVDTCVTMVKKSVTAKHGDMIFKDGSKSTENPKTFYVNPQLYTTSVRSVIFTPTKFNQKVQKKLISSVLPLYNEWWERINTSKNIIKNQDALALYRKQLKPGDITLLGLITDGGQGLATANNGKYVGVLKGTKEADRIITTRAEKLYQSHISEYSFRSKDQAQEFLESKSESEIRELFDNIKEKYGRDIFGQGYLFRIINPLEVMDVSQMSDEEKRDGLKGARTFVPYDKGDKDGNRWYLRTPYYIDWSYNNVQFLKNDPKARFQGYTFYFRAGFCWILTLNEQSEYQKARIKDIGVFDVNAMSLFSLSDYVSEKYLICLINSYLIFDYKRCFINGSSAFQINDARQLPVIIPTQEQLQLFEDVFDRAYAVKIAQFDKSISKNIAQTQLAEIQAELDELVMDLYDLTAEERDIVRGVEGG